MSTILYLLLVTYGTIFVSELLGDKSIYTISSLGMRFRPVYVFCGFTAAFMVKMSAAVLLGRMIAELPRSVVSLTSAATFFLTAFVIWFKKTNDGTTPRAHENYFSRAALITFAAILFSEWADIGQIMAATLTARYGLPLVVWLGATLALITKGLLALALGRGLRKCVPLHVLRPVSASLCIIMGIISALAPLFESRALHLP
jgi:putative Ca2+/H+ antiporter (TMEM165/GDT1 family)